VHPETYMTDCAFCCCCCCCLLFVLVSCCFAGYLVSSFCSLTFSHIQHTSHHTSLTSHTSHFVYTILPFSALHICVARPSVTDGWDGAVWDEDWDEEEDWDDADQAASSPASQRKRVSPALEKKQGKISPSIASLLDRTPAESSRRDTSEGPLARMQPSISQVEEEGEDEEKTKTKKDTNVKHTQEKTKPAQPTKQVYTDEVVTEKEAHTPTSAAPKQRAIRSLFDSAQSTVSSHDRVSAPAGPTAKSTHSLSASAGVQKDADLFLDIVDGVGAPASCCSGCGRVVPPLCVVVTLVCAASSRSFFSSSFFFFFFFFFVWDASVCVACVCVSNSGAVDSQSRPHPHTLSPPFHCFRSLWHLSLSLS
jgi:hypothetical protein